MGWLRLFLSRIIFVFVGSFLMSIMESSAQDANETGIAIGIYVYDADSRTTLNTAKVSLMNNDSIVIIDSMKCVKVMKNSDFFRYQSSVPRMPEYILKVAARGYKTEYRTIKPKNPFVIEVLLTKESVLLDEVVVTGSKILMINRGDTIIYNASALQLSNSSMLDALIRQLPGVELHQNGRIMVNGKFVKSLLVNGRDFFRGDPKIALRNLPSYYVDQVKVYHEADMAKKVIFGDSVYADPERDPLMMDVLLKKDYSEGWIANMDLGAGEYERWLARLFAMRYTKHSGLYLFGNANNINDEQLAGKDGKWNGQFADYGKKNMKQFGMGFDGDDKNTGMQYNLSGKVNITDDNCEEVVSADKYYHTGDVYRRSRSISTDRGFAFSGKGDWMYPKTGIFLFQLSPWLSVDKSKKNSQTHSASFSADPYDAYRGASLDSLYSPMGSYSLTQKLIVEEERHNMDDTRHFSTGATGDAMINIGGKWVDIRLNGDYHHTNREKYTLWKIRQQPALSPQITNQYAELPEKSYFYQGEATLQLKRQASPKSFGMDATYGYKQAFMSGRRQLYNIGFYDCYRDDTDRLPSTTDSLQAVTDIRNSFHTTTLEHTHTFKVKLKWYKWQLLLPISWTSRRIDDYRSGKESRLQDRRIVPDIFLNYGARPFSFIYEFHTRLPDMRKMLSLRDDSDPLNIQIGNPDLKSAKEHSVRMGWNRLEQKDQQKVGINWNLFMVQDAVSIAQQYDLATGITTYFPSNIQGNWQTSCDVTYGQQIDKRRQIAFTTKTTARYQRSVDYASTVLQSNYRNKVDNIRLSEELTAKANLWGLHEVIIGGVRWNHAESKIANFLVVNAVDFNYGFTLTGNIWERLDFDSELTMWSRRGYTDRSMNDDVLMWNLSVSYAFGKLGQWIAKLEGHDILHQQSTVRSTTNAQGRTEIWYNTIPPYWMAHLIFQFKKEPQKRK